MPPRAAPGQASNGMPTASKTKAGACRPAGWPGGSANWQAPAFRSAYCSHMCSTAGERLARLGEAIDELAADWLAPHAASSNAAMQERLASIWAMVAELDPELARRVCDYHPGRDQGSGASKLTGE